MSSVNRCKSFMLGVSILSLSNNFLLTFGTVPTVRYLELFRLSGIWNCSDCPVFRTVPTVRYLELFRLFGIWNCSDCPVFGTVPTVQYFELFRMSGIFCFSYYYDRFKFEFENVLHQRNVISFLFYLKHIFSVSDRNFNSRKRNRKYVFDVCYDFRI